MKLKPTPPQTQIIKEGENPNKIKLENNFNGITTSYSFPKYVGGYRMGDPPFTVQFNFTKKPNWFHRKMMNLCLGWEWVDAK